MSLLAVRSTLTARELEVAECLLAGMADKEIARELGIAIKTVETHLANMRSVLGAKNTRHLIAMVARMQPRAPDPAFVRACQIARGLDAAA